MYYHNKISEASELQNDQGSVYAIMVNPHQFPGLAHFGMFVKYIELMGTA